VVFEDRGGADGDGEGVFGQRYAAPDPPPASIPALGPTALGLLAMLVALLASRLLRRSA
jgi:exosortase sorting signal-containing protein